MQNFVCLNTLIGTWLCWENLCEKKGLFIIRLFASAVKCTAFAIVIRFIEQLSIPELVGWNVPVWIQCRHFIFTPSFAEYYCCIHSTNKDISCRTSVYTSFLRFIKWHLNSMNKYMWRTTLEKTFCLFVDLCANVIANVSNNVQTHKKFSFSSWVAAFHF